MVNFMGPGGGMAIPPYLQGRKPMITPMNQAGGGNIKPMQPMTQPMITPKATVMPGENLQQPQKPTAPAMQQPSNFQNMAKQASNLGTQDWKSVVGNSFGARPTITPPSMTPTPQPGAGGTSPISPAGQSAYDVLKGDLEDQRRSGMSNAVSDASARGVYYGSPLTTSQGDTETQYLRGLGQLQAGVLGNEQQNELSRLQIGAGLLGQTGAAQGGKIDPSVLQMMGSLFAPSAQRSGPTQQPTQQQWQQQGGRITPKNSGLQ